LRGARDERERGVAGVQMGKVRDLVGEERAATAAALRPAAHAGLVEEAVDDVLAAALEQVVQAHVSVRALEAVVLLDRHPWHSAALGGERVPGEGEAPSP
jgi:hypothetical protein